MVEPIRLVIWDLDETFWKGAVTEGGFEYLRQNHDAVIALAERGIISSVCSKNDPSVILPILERYGILEYFVFPDISWEPKGRRVARIIENMQLRAPTVMFIDDNPNNLAEAVAFAPGLQIENETFVANILVDPRFAGKDDKQLSRLNQYRLLETRKKDESEAAGSNEDFLRTCDIRVRIDYDVASQIDRAIELINRTNQLNFTKKRLPDKIEDARRILGASLAGFNQQAGLVSVTDKYGDYGIVGFFLTANTRKTPVPGAAYSHLVHFCFSCRTLGMLIEQWVYDYLRRPELEVVGEVLTDLSVPREIDWVRLAPLGEETTATQEKTVGRMVIWGGCEANAVSVYLAACAESLTVIGNHAAPGLFNRTNSATVALDAMERVDSLEFAAEAELFGLPLDQTAVDFYAGSGSGSAFVFNCSFDAGRARLYRHKVHGWALWLEPTRMAGFNMVLLPEEELVKKLDALKIVDEREQILKIAKHLRENYVAVDRSEAEKTEAMRQLIERAPPGARIIIAVDHDYTRADPKATTLTPVPSVAQYSNMMRALASEYAYVEVVSFSDAIEADHEIQIANHYDRLVYFRFARKVIETLEKLPEKPVAGPAPETAGVLSAVEV